MIIIEQLILIWYYFAYIANYIDF